MKKNPLIVQVLLIVAILLLSGIPAQAVLTLQLTIDEPTSGRAVLSGNLAQTLFESNLNSQEITGTHWFVKTRVIRLQLDAGNYYNLVVQAMHLTAPHAGEAKPGLLLGDASTMFQDNLGGLPDSPVITGFGPQDKSTRLIHPGSIDHYDSLFSHIDDLNGAARGYISAADQLSVRIDLKHSTIPEPSTLLLLGGGVLASLAMVHKRAGKAWRKENS